MLFNVTDYKYLSLTLHYLYVFLKKYFHNKLNKNIITCLPS